MITIAGIAINNKVGLFVEIIAITDPKNIIKTKARRTATMDRKEFSLITNRSPIPNLRCTVQIHFKGCGVCLTPGFRHSG